MKSLRVLVIHAAVGGLGDRIRVEYILKFLRESGFKVHEVLLPSITFGYIKRKGLSNILAHILPLRKQKIYRPKIPIINYLYLNLAENFLSKTIRNLDFDVVLAETSLVGWLTYSALKDSSVPLIVDVHGLAGAEAKGRGDKYWFIKEALEADVFNNCSHLLVVSNKMKEYIVHHFGVPNDKVSVIYNGAEPQKHQAKFNHPLKVVYAGIFAYWEKVDDYLEIAKKADLSSFKFYLAGTGPMKKHILARIKREKIPVKYLGYVPRSRMLGVMSKMQVGIAPSTKDLARLVAFPIKVLDYMSCGLPVIAPLIGDWGKMIERENSGITIEDDSVEEYVTALEMLKRKDVWIDKSNNGIRAIKVKYSWNKVLSALKSIIICVSGR